MTKNNKNIRKIYKTHNIPRECNERYLALGCDNGSFLRRHGISYAGISELVSGYQIYTKLRRHMLIGTTAGSGYLVTPDAEYRIGSGEIIVVPASNEVMFGVSSAKWNITWFYLETTKEWRFLQQRGIEQRQVNLMPQLHQVSSWLQDILLEPATPGSSSLLLVSYSELLMTLLNKIVKGTEVPNYNRIDMRLNKMLHKVQSSLHHKWNIKDMAEVMHITPSALQRTVKRYLNTTPRQLLIKFRMQQAEQFLIYSSYPLKIIAEKLGYSDEFVFSTAFRNYHGISPKRYRQQY